MLTRVLSLGLAAWLLGACAHAPQDAPDVSAKAEPAAAPAPVVKEKEQAPAPAAAEPAKPTPVVEAPPPAPPPPPANLWIRIRAGFRLPNMDGALVRDQEQWYASNPEYVARMIERSSHFLYYIVQEVERRRMPTEIVLLPMIESAYNPQAYSRSHASGMWQFIPSTGRKYGLRQNFWYDGRRDVLAATSAALDYLEKLHGDFGDWTLALAAYNWGEGAVGRAIARNQARGLPTDYESLPMPLETRKYLPKLQAVKNIVANPGHYGIALLDIPDRPYFATVTTHRHIDLQLAASLAEMTLEEFRFLNPAHNKPVIKADGSETIVLPVDKVAVFEKNLETHDRPLVSWQTYTVKRSDRPERIASKHGMTLAELKEVNGIPPRRNIVAGQTLLVPLRGDAEPHLPDLPAPRVSTRRYRSKGSSYCYVVNDSGGKKRVPCSVPAKKKATPVKAPAPKERPAPAKTSGVSVGTATGS